MKPLTIYKASAGSGKTFTLATEYIKLVVSDPSCYRNMLDLETDSTGVNATKTDGKRVNKAIKQQRGEK